jgi:hypothetical protein
VADNGVVTFPDGAVFGNSEIVAAPNNYLYLYGGDANESSGQSVRIYGSNAQTTSTSTQYTGGNIRLYGGRGVNGGTGGQIRLRTYDANNSSNSWYFNPNGNLELPGTITFPDNTVQTTAYNPGNPLIWAARANTNVDESTTQAVAYDSQGNAYVLIAQYPNGPGDDRTTIAKLSSIGDQIWTVDLTAGTSVNPWSLVCDGSDDLYVIVQRYNGGINRYNNVVMKLAGSNGDILWQVDIQDSQSADNMQAVPLSYGPINGVVVAGTAFNGNDRDFFIAIIASDGSTPIGASNFKFGDQWDQRAYGVAIDNANGDLVLVGRKQSYTDNAYYLEMVKFSQTGGVAWQKSLTVDGNYEIQGTDVCLLADGNWAVVATHQISGGSPQRYGIITMKVDNTDGSVMWSREISNDCSNVSSSIATDGAGNIYISANTYDGNGIGNIPLTNKLLGTYDTNGAGIWQKYFRCPGDNWVVDNNWWSQIGSTGRTLAIHSDRLLVAANLIPVTGDGPGNSLATMAQLTLLGEDETIGVFETRNSYLTDSAVVLTSADTTYNYVFDAHQTLSTGTSISTQAGTLTFSVDHNTSVPSQLAAGASKAILQSNGLLVNETGRSITGELDRVTDNSNIFNNTPIGVKNASGYKRLIEVTSSTQTWFDISDLAVQVNTNPEWIMGVTIDYNVVSSDFTNNVGNGSMTGQIIIASSNDSYRDISVTHYEAVLTRSNSSNDVIFANLDMWQPDGWLLKAGRTDGNSQQLDIIWTAKVFINASEEYC